MTSRTSETRRLEISVNDMAAVVEAAALLRQYGLISATKARDVGRAVKEDGRQAIDRYEGCDDLQRVANEAYRMAGALVK
jgi:hypothetical protein